MAKIKILLFFLSGIFLAAALFVLFDSPKGDVRERKIEISSVSFNSPVLDAVLSEDCVFVALEDSKIFKYSLDGVLLASIDLECDMLTSKVTLLDDMLIVANIDGEVFALSKDLKKIIWKKTFGEKICGNFFKSGDSLVFGSYDQFLRAISCKDGAEIFKLKTSDAINANPALYKSFALVGNCAGELFCADLNSKKELWKVEFGSHIPLSPMADSGLAIVADYSGVLAAFKFKDGKKVWENADFKASPSVQIVSDGLGNLFFLSQAGELCKIASLSAKLLLKESFGSSKGHLKLQDGELMLALDSGLIYILNKSDFSEIFKFNAMAPISVCDFNKKVIIFVDLSDTMQILRR